ncbi:MAG: hypothetical protein QM751_13700 [Paludibacteraceae bacterium]
MELIQNIKYLKSIPFTKEAFETASYSTKRYRLGGRVTRFLISQWMKL